MQRKSEPISLMFVVHHSREGCKENFTLIFLVCLSAVPHSLHLPLMYKTLADLAPDFPSLSYYMQASQVSFTLQCAAVHSHSRLLCLWISLPALPFPMTTAWLPPPSEMHSLTSICKAFSHSLQSPSDHSLNTI